MQRITLIFGDCTFYGIQVSYINLPKNLTQEITVAKPTQKCQSGWGSLLRLPSLNGTTSRKAVRKRTSLRCTWPGYQCSGWRISLGRCGAARYLRPPSVSWIRKPASISRLGGTGPCKVGDIYLVWWVSPIFHKRWIGCAAASVLCDSCSFLHSLYKTDRSLISDLSTYHGSGRRIRTLTYGVRVRCATFTQSRYFMELLTRFELVTSSLPTVLAMSVVF